VAVAGRLQRLVDLESDALASAVAGERWISHAGSLRYVIAPLTFRPVSLDQDPARSLVEAMRAEIAEIYTGVVLDGPEMPKAGTRELGPPGGIFLVGFGVGGTAACGGGVKDFGNGTCEIKRMYVVPEARNAGRGRELLEALEDAARQLGYKRARLDTGPRQERSERMYRAAGYEPIGNFNSNPIASFFGEKSL